GGAMPPPPAERATTGFTTREFAVLETHPPADACAALRSRIELLFDAINATSIAARIVEARQRNGAAGTKVYHANSCHPGGPGHIYAFHHGGRRDPQFRLRWFTPPRMPCCMRIGIGFNAASSGRDPDRDGGQEQVLHYFERFQRTVAKSWRTELARWMGANGGFLQAGPDAPSQTLQPPQAVDWLINCRNAAADEGGILGRWLFLGRPEAAAVMRDRSTLARTVEETFRALFPVWVSTYAGTD